MLSRQDPFSWMRLEFEQELASRHARFHVRTTPFSTSDHTVSLARLRHHPPAKAIDAYAKGVKACDRGDYSKSAMFFEKAIELDRDFSDAHGNLGVAYMFLNRHGEARAEFRRAMELDPATSSHHSNLAIILELLGQRQEALTEAEQAVSLDPGNPKSQYLLGVLLSTRPEMRTRAARHLSYAAREVAEAHQLLAALHRSAGEDLLAEIETKRYQEAVREHK
jgi:Flp pilus assembly protein TadD